MRMRRKHSELIQEPGAEQREPLSVGCWVVVAHPAIDRPLCLGMVGSGPTYEHSNGHAIGEVWALTDGTKHPVMALTRVDVESVIVEGVTVAAGIRTAGSSPERDMTALRVHRAACLARQLLAGGQTRSDISDESWGQLVGLILADDEVASAEQGWRDFVRDSLPKLLHNLRDAGALWLAIQPGWTPGDASIPHPNWRDK